MGGPETNTITTSYLAWSAHGYSKGEKRKDYLYLSEQVFKKKEHRVIKIKIIFILLFYFGNNANLKVNVDPFVTI
jgi:lysozyme family protein